MRASAREERDEAALHLERCLERIRFAGTVYREVLLLEASVFSAWHRRDAQKAIQWRNRIVKKIELPELLNLRAQIAIDSALDNFADALVSCDKAWDLLKKTQPLSPSYNRGASGKWT